MKQTPYYTAGQNIDCDLEFTAEKERALFERFYTGGPDALEARDTLIKQFLKLVLSLSVRCARGRITQADAISAGNMALIEILETRRFDPARGLRFSTFLGHFIRGRVSREVRNFPKIEQTGQRYLNDEDYEYRGHQNASAPSRQDDKVQVADEPEISALDLSQMKDILKPALGRLNPRERYFVEQFYFNGLSLWEASRVLPESLGGPVSRQMASKIHSSALKKMKFMLPDKENPFK